MKCRIPHPFIRFIKKYSVQSLLLGITKIALECFNNPSNEFGLFASYMSYSVANKMKPSKRSVLVVQTWLIDLIYHIACMDSYGTQQINRDEALYLIDLFSDYTDKNTPRNRTQLDMHLYLYGFFGEQKRFQETGEFYKDFAREKYILDVISEKTRVVDKNIIDVRNTFKDITGYTLDEYSALMFVTTSCFISKSPIVIEDQFSSLLDNPLLCKTNIMKIMKRYSIEIENIRDNPLGRQVFYAKPFIKVDKVFVSVNPFIALSCFTNANYWVLRNYFFQKDKNESQKFIRDFGIMFEEYVREVFSNCLSDEQYHRIPESNTEKRADWRLKIGGYDFLIEQKSGLSMLGIKQSQPDIEAMKKHILKNWGEAVEQLYCTQIAEKLSNPIKIILVYEDYYKSECLDELFELNHSIRNDQKYWLVTIRELEMIMITYKKNPELFFKIIREKDEAELNESKDGRELLMFLTNNEIKRNEYLEEFGITNQFERIVHICTGKNSNTEMNL